MKSESPTSPASPSALKSYFLAARPKTWIASLSPVLIGISLAPTINISILGATLLFSLLIQIGTNYANDYFDFINGADTALRVGPKRAVQQGWIAPNAMLMATLITFALAFIVALPLITNLWHLILAFVCIACGILYTGGPKPLGYLGLGELFVLVFFGPVAGVGAYYLQTGSIEPDAFVASLAPGLLSCAILIANNLRDEVSDRATNKRTLVVRFGRLFGLFEYGASIFLASLVPVILVLFYGYTPLLLSASIVFPLTFFLPPFLPVSAALLFLYTLLFYATVSL